MNKTIRRHIHLLGVLACLLVPTQVLAVLKVMTTTSDIAAITREVGKQLVQVKSLTPGASDPHFAVAKPSMIRDVSQADLLI